MTARRQGAPLPEVRPVGKGEAIAKIGVNGPAPAPLTFDVKAYKTKSSVDGKEARFLMTMARCCSDRDQAVEGPRQVRAEAPHRRARARPARRLRAMTGLVSLETTLGGKKGKNKLLATVGCKKKKQPFKAVLTFVDNRVGHRGTSVAGHVEVQQ